MIRIPLNICVATTEALLVDIVTLITGLFQAMLGCIVIFFVVNYLRQKQIANSKDEVAKLEARMAALRIFLKGKVKKKSQFLRSVFPEAIHTGDPVDLLTNELGNLPFETNEHFQKYFDISKQINSLITISTERARKDMEKQAEKQAGKLVPTALSTVSDPATQAKKVPRVIDISNVGFMSADFKNEMAIVKLVHEIVDLSFKIKLRVEQYNTVNMKHPMPEPIAFNFPAISEVKRIFSENAVSNFDEKTAA